MVNPLLIPEIRQMIVEKDDQGLTEIMTELHPASIAEFAEGLSTEEAWKLLSHGSIQSQGEVFPYFSPEKELQLLEGIGKEQMLKLSSIALNKSYVLHKILAASVCLNMFKQDDAVGAARDLSLLPSRESNLSTIGFPKTPQANCSMRAVVRWGHTETQIVGLFGLLRPDFARVQGRLDKTLILYGSLLMRA